MSLGELIPLLFLEDFPFKKVSNEFEWELSDWVCVLEVLKLLFVEKEGSH